MKNKFDKNDLIFNFQQAKFPTELIAKDVMVHKELIFSEKSEEPELGKSTKKIKYSGCYVLEDEIEPKGKGGFRKGGQQGKMNRPKDVWRKNEPEENTGGFFDDFKGKTDVKQVAQFKRNLEVTMTEENSISIQKGVFLDFLNKTSEGKQVSTLKYYEPSDKVPKTSQPLSADNFFDNADKIMGTISTTESTHSKPHKTSKLSQALNNIDPNPNVVNIDQIFKVNEYLQYPKEENLWYIFHPTAKSSFGPISSVNIKEMYSSKMLSGQSEIRFIDIYNLKQKKPFSFFSLKEIEFPTFLDEIEISPLLKVAVAMKNKQLEKEGVKSIEKSEKTTVTSVPGGNKNTNVNSNVTVEVPYSSDSIYNVVTSSKPDNKQSKKKEPEGEMFFDSAEPSTTPNQTKKNKKTPKGKSLDFDPKLGFKVEEETESRTKSNKKPVTNFNPVQSSVESTGYQKQRKDQKDNSIYNQQGYDDNYYYEEGYDQGYNQQDYNYYKGGNYQGGGNYFNNRNNNYWKK